MIDDILSGTFFFLSTLFSNIYCKIKFIAQNRSDYHGKLDFWKSLIKIVVCFSLPMFHNNIVKISEIFNKWKLLKTYIKTNYRFLQIYSHFTKEKVKKSIFKTIG